MSFMQRSLSNATKPLSLSVRPLAGFSVSRFPHQLVFEQPLSSALLKTYQVKKWSELESYGTFKPADFRSVADKCAQIILDSTMLLDGSRYFVGVLWAEDNIYVLDKFFVQVT